MCGIESRGNRARVTWLLFASLPGTSEGVVSLLSQARLGGASGMGWVEGNGSGIHSVKIVGEIPLKLSLGKGSEPLGQD